MKSPTQKTSVLADMRGINVLTIINSMSIRPSSQVSSQFNSAFFFLIFALSPLKRKSVKMGPFVGKREVSESNEAQNNGLTTASSAAFPLPADSSVGGRIVGSRTGFLSKKLKKGLCTGNHIF